MRDVMDVIISRIGEPISVNFPEHLFHCPFCESREGSEDRRGHMYVNEEKGYFCHRCEARGSIVWLLRNLGVSQDEIESHIPDIVLVRQRTGVPVSTPTPSPIQPVAMPENVDDVWHVPAVWAYAQSRGLSRFDCEYYKLQAWIDNRGNPRLLFPDYTDNGTLVYWTARAVQDGVKPKYDAAKDSERSQCVWNLNRVRKDRPIYVAEGIMSARACGSNGVAIYGKFLSDPQMSLISNRAGPAGVRIVLDGEAWKSTFRAVKKFQRNGVPCGAVMLPYKTDPDDMDPQTLSRMLLESQPLSSTGLLQLRSQYI